MLESLGRNWNCRWLGPLALDVGLLCKNNKQRRSTGDRPLPLRCLSQFFPVEENINSLGNEVLAHKSAYLSPMGWPGIYSICFSQLDGDKDSLLLDEGFSFLIVVILIRDNWKAVIGNYLTSLIGEILFDLKDMSSCFGPIFGGCHQGPIATTGPVFNPVFGLASWACVPIISNPISCPPQPLTK